MRHATSQRPTLLYADMHHEESTLLVVEKANKHPTQLQPPDFGRRCTCMVHEILLCDSGRTKSPNRSDQLKKRRPPCATSYIIVDMFYASIVVRVRYEYCNASCIADSRITRPIWRSINHYQGYGYNASVNHVITPLYLHIPCSPMSKMCRCVGCPYFR